MASNKSDLAARRLSSKINEIGTTPQYLPVFLCCCMSTLASKKIWFTHDSAKDPETGPRMHTGSTRCIRGVRQKICIWGNALHIMKLCAYRD